MPSAASTLCVESCPSAQLHLFGKLTHGLFGNHATLSTRQRGFRCIHGRQNFGAIAFALFPKRQRFRDRIRLASKTSGSYTPADKCFLIGS